MNDKIIRNKKIYNFSFALKDIKQKNNVNL